jgi:hypothetical protein
MQSFEQSSSAAMNMTADVVECVVIRRKRGFVLVEWAESGRLYRSWVMPDMIERDNNRVVAVRNPRAGVPYGIDFSHIVQLRATPDDLDREMKRAGIWTLQDMRENPQKVIGALQSAYGVDFSVIMQAATSYEKELED